jgi:uncharacterized protein YdeI (YjbR/CyaY-like superfamily)
VSEPIFFESPAELRAWFEANHDSATELFVGYHRVGTGRPTITWSESVDEALCFGWIDGVRRRVDDTSYTNRFTPRKPTSNWSAINVAKVAELTKQGRMHPAGLAAFERRRPDRTGTYSYEMAKAAFDPEMEEAFRKKKRAWAFFEAQPAGYRRLATYWVMSAKRPETRQKRLATLMADSAAGRRLAQFSR